MKFSLYAPVIMLMLPALSACESKPSGNNSHLSSNPSARVFAEAPVAASRVIIDGDTVVVGKLTSKPETVTLLASEMFDDLKFVRLENSDEALVGGGDTWVTDKRIIIYDGKSIKQFDHTGKYLGEVARKGQEPGEYAIAPYHITADEEAGRIFMAQYSADRIMTYDLEGRYTGDIPLAYKTRKSIFTVDAARRLITIAALQFTVDGEVPVVWEQDFEGNVTDSVVRTYLAVNPDFSNEVNAGITPAGDGITYSLYRIEPEPDTLYTYIDSRFRPDFTFDFGDDTPVHGLMSLPQFYVVTSYGSPVPTSEHSAYLPQLTPFVIDRTTLRGAPAVLMFDDFGTLTINQGWSDSHTPGYFSLCLDPGDLLDCLTAAPDTHPLATDEGMNRMHQLRESIDPDDNCYVLIGRWKTDPTSSRP